MMCGTDESVHLCPIVLKGKGATAAWVLAREPHDLLRRELVI